MSVWSCPPDWLAHLAGWLGGLLVGMMIGWYLRGRFRKVTLIVDPSYHQGGKL